MGAGRQKVIFLVWGLCAPWLVFATAVPVLTVGALVILLGVQVKARWRGGYPAGTIDQLITLYLTLATISAIFSPVPLLAIRKLTVLTLGVHLYFFVRDYLSDPAGETLTNKLHHITHITTLFALFASLASLFVMRWPERRWLPLGNLDRIFPHLTGSFTVHHNEIAGMLLMLCPIILITIRQSQNLRWRQVAKLTLAITLFVLLMTQSRMAWLTLAISLLIWGTWQVWTPRRLTVAVTLLSLTLIAMLIIQTQTTQSSLSDWLLAVDAASKQGFTPPTSWQTRLELWQTSLHALRDYPVVGVGLGTFAPVTRLNYPLAFVSLNDDFGHAHNLLLQSGVTMGWGSVLVLLCVFVLLGRGLLFPGRGHIPTYLQRAFTISLISYCLFNLVDYIGPEQRTGLPIWAFLAICSAIIRENQTLLAYAKRTPYIAIAFSLILWLTPLREQNLIHLQLDNAQLTNTSLPDKLTLHDTRRRGLYTYLQGDLPTATIYWQDSHQPIAFLESRGRLAAIEGDFVTAIAWYNTALTIDNNVATLYYWRGRNHFQEANYTSALADYQRAFELSQTQLSAQWQANILLSWAESHATLGQWQEAATRLQQGSLLAPDDPFLHKLLGDVLTELGDHEGAKKAYEKAPPSP